MHHFLTCTARVFIFLTLLFTTSIIHGKPTPVKPNEPELYALYCWAENYIKFADDIKDTGISWIRMGGFGGDNTDKAVLLAARNNVHIAPSLGMRELSHGRTIPIDQAVSQFREHVRKAVARYGPGGKLWQENPDAKPLPIRYWEIWNEPNIEFLTPPDENILRTELYAKLLLCASEEIRAFDPEAKIVAFNTAGGVPYHGTGVPPDGMWQKLKYIGWRKFISDVVAITGSDCFDVVGTHPYTKPLSPEAGDVIKGIDMLGEIATKQGFLDKPVWFTEVGFPIEYPRNQNVRDEREQACFTIRLFAISGAHNVQQVQIMYVEDIIYGPDNTQRSFGFYTAPGQWREQARATQTMIRLINNPRNNPHILSEITNGIYAYKFRGANGESIIMAWNSGGESISTTFDTDAKVLTKVSMLGEIEPVAVINKQVTVELTEAPIYLVPLTEKQTAKLLSGNIP